MSGGVVLLLVLTPVKQVGGTEVLPEANVVRTPDVQVQAPSVLPGLQEVHGHGAVWNPERVLSGLQDVHGHGAVRNPERVLLAGVPHLAHTCNTDKAALPTGHVTAGNLRDASSFGHVCLL